MELLTEPVTRLPRLAVDSRTANEWLEAVSSGTCDRAEFLSGVGDLLHRAPDTGWELLALLDQYHRRGKITSETFGSLKSHLQYLLMGKSGGEGSVPAPRAPSAAASSKIAATKPFAAPRSNPLRPTVTPIFPTHDADPEHDGDREEELPAAAGRPERVLKEGDVLRGRYRVQEVLGQGGMGTVFGAIDQYRVDPANGDQRVAIKVLHSAVVQRPRLFMELRREFQHLQSLSHPNIVRVHEFDRDDDIAFFTMERLSGALLSRVLVANRTAPLFRPYALAIVRDVGAAIVHAHDHGVIHGDLNPVNIFITDNGEVRVLDFGAASQLRRGPWISEFENQQQMAVATPSYASCELLEGETPDPRDDVYALACVTYVLLTGKHPFRDHTALKARSSRMKPPRPSGLSHRQWQALRSGLYLDRARRPSDIRAWMARLDVQAPTRLPALPELFKPRVQRRYGALWAAVAAIACVAAVAWWATTHPQDTARAGASLRGFWNDPPIRSPQRAAAVDAPARTLAQPQQPDHASPEPPKAQRLPPDGAHPAPPAPASAPSVSAGIASAAPVSVARALPSTATSTNTGSGAATGAEVGQPINSVHARIELATDTVEVNPGEATAQVLIRRSRSLRGDVAFTWWTESGTAKPGRDFVPVKSEVEHIPEGRNSVKLLIPVVVDPARRDARSFYVVIDEPSDNAALGPRTLTMVTIPGLD
jgi:serine/threonine protein kinase